MYWWTYYLFKNILITIAVSAKYIAWLHVLLIIHQTFYSIFYKHPLIVSNQFLEIYSFNAFIRIIFKGMVCGYVPHITITFMKIIYYKWVISKFANILILDHVSVHLRFFFANCYSFNQKSTVWPTNKNLHSKLNLENMYKLVGFVWWDGRNFKYEYCYYRTFNWPCIVFG